MNGRTTLCVALCTLVAAFSAVSSGQDFEQPPISYSTTAPKNVVSELADRLERGEARLEYDARLGYLMSFLKELDIPVSSQMLVYSKTSMQRERITPDTPRALYFNDDVYVGYCYEGNVLEIAVADPQLGGVFYTIDQNDDTRARVVRQTDNCLICHGSSQTKDVPGFVVRSVLTDTKGLPILSAGTHRIDHSSPLEDRWGGWYVTGTHGNQKHLGNLVIQGRSAPDKIDNAAGQNVTSVADRFKASAYPNPHSDIVALMVLEHQSDAHNFIVRANHLTRQALHYQKALNRELGESEDHLWDSTKSRIKSGCETLVEYLLFSEEAKLTAKITGTTSFAADFAARGVRDSQGRSLRDFDLERRLFKYPCSYLIYSDSFSALPEEAKEYVYRRLYEVLTGEDQTKPFAHLTADDRKAILEILRDTLPDLPAYWQPQPAG